MNLSHRLWGGITFLSGVCLTLSFAPFNHAYLAIISLVGLFLSWHDAKTPNQAALRGFIFGLGLFGFGVTWVFVSIFFYGGANVWVSMLMACLFAVFWALFPAFTGYLGVKFAINRPYRLLWFMPFLWILIEYVRGEYLLNGFPWFQVAYSQLDTAYAGFIPILGVYGTGFLMVLTASLLSYMVITQQRLILNGLAISLLLVLGFGLKHIQWTERLGEPIKITLIQGNVSQDQKWRPENLTNTLFSYQQMTSRHWDSDVIIWPETAIPAYLHQVEASYLTPLATEAQAHQTDLIISVAAKSDDRQHSYNTVLTLGSEQGMYKKNHLLPFGEYLPLQPFSGWVLDLIGVHLGHFTPGGDQQPLLKAGGYLFAPSICYEDAFASEMIPSLPKAAYLVNVTNDAWFGDSLEPHQHMQIARMRALESGRYLVRSTNTGITAFVAPNGKIIKQAPLFKTVTLTENILPMTGSTPYVRLGHQRILWGLGVFFSLFFIIDVKFNGFKPPIK